MIIRDPIRLLERLLESTADVAHQKNIQATIDMLRSGVTFNARQIAADGTLIDMNDWNPTMGPFFMPSFVGVPLF